MAVQNMTRTDFTPTGYVYSDKVVVADGQTSNEYKIPTGTIIDVGMDITGDGKIQFTFDPHSIIDDGSANYTDWDGASQINLAVTGFQVVSNSGEVTARITIKSLND